MESKSFLLSFFNIYKDLSITEANMLSNHIEVNYSTPNGKEELQINFESIPGFYQYAQNIVEVQSKILNLKVDYSTIELSIANMYIQELIKKTINYSSIKHGKLMYIVNSKEISVTLPSKPVLDTIYNNLLLCSLLNNGYVIKEVKGSHFIFSCEQLIQNMVTETSCTCDYFSFYRECEHNRSAKSLLKNRGVVKPIISTW